MTARVLPPIRLTPARDPELDGTIVGRAREAVAHWSPGAVFVLAFLAVHGKLAEWDAIALADARQRESANATVELESLRNAHEHRIASGCSTLFYLVQGDPGERLYQAATALDHVRGKYLAALPGAGSPK